MQSAARLSLLLLVVGLLLGGGALGCSRRSLSQDGSVGGIDAGVTGAGGAAGSSATGAGGGGGLSGTGAGGDGGLSGTGAGGAAGVVVTGACMGASDPRLVVASQRILRLTMNETLNTVRHLFGDAEAAALVTGGFIAGDINDLDRRFPPLQEHEIFSDSFRQLDQISAHVASYVLDNFALVTACRPATDACATAYLDALAARAYRRRLTPAEQTRFAALYARLRAPQLVNGYEVTFTVEEATSYAVHALLSSPQMLWRWELGDPALASSAPSGIPLTDQELATHVAFFLTDRPPDDTLLAAANAGTLRANLDAQVERLLASSVAKDWLRTIIETYFGLNTVTAAPVDSIKFPFASPALLSAMGIEARRFLDRTLWSGRLRELLTSQTTFLNTELAASIYGVATPAGATATTFVEATLPADQRSGLLTNAAFLTSRSSPDGTRLLIPRGLLVAATLVCAPYPGPDIFGGPDPGPQTAQQEVAGRAAVPVCNACHEQFDRYGLALTNYDVLGIYRTQDELGRPIDPHTTLPAALGGDVVMNAVELAQKLATKPAFTNCMAKTLLQYALVDLNATVDVPWPQRDGGCATTDIVARYQAAGGVTFSELVRATAATPAFALRKAAP
jgi:hypothetical protein